MSAQPGLDPALLFSSPDAPDESDLYKCVHCGFCLQVCPTYIQTGLETESPRGRIALMKAVNERRIGITDTVMRHWDLCIQCRACEVACPSGVPYGNLIEAAMAQVADLRKPNILQKSATDISLKGIIPHQRRLEALMSLTKLYQKSGLQSLVRKSGVLDKIAPSVAALESSMPDVSATYFRARGQTIQATGERRARVAILSGCVMPLVNGPQMNAAVRVLARNGCEIAVPKDQACCGAINSHVGDLDTARKLARRNIDVFMDAGVEYVIVASAGCGARMKEYGHLLREDPDYSRKAESFSRTVKDINEFLVELPFDPPRSTLDYRVTYQDSCHLGNAQRITAAPRQILRSIPGVEFIELPNSGQCCGAGGTYTITERDFSLRVLNAKMDAFETVGADVFVTANPGCLLQLQFGIQDRDLSAQVKYITDLLDEAYQKERPNADN